MERASPVNQPPLEIKKLGNKELRLVWPDGHVSQYGFRYLRQNCQCAHCVEEWSGKPILERESVPQGLEGLKVSVVGKYALSIQFSDGHGTGLYAFDHLRKICSCGECESSRARPQEKQFLSKEDLRGRA